MVIFGRNIDTFGLALAAFLPIVATLVYIFRLRTHPQNTPKITTYYWVVMIIFSILVFLVVLWTDSFAVF